eukprot:1088816-Rhodomonas_salina.1
MSSGLSRARANGSYPCSVAFGHLPVHRDQHQCMRQEKVASRRLSTATPAQYEGVVHETAVVSLTCAHVCTKSS